MDRALNGEPDLDFELVYDDGEPMESNWHRIAMNLLIEVAQQAMAARGREDYFAGGNMFIYYSHDQARTIARAPNQVARHFRGPDFFLVGGVDGRLDRKAWVIWDEEGRYPDVIVELLSPSTAAVDRTTKKSIYEKTFRTPEYYLYDPTEDVLEGHRLSQAGYQPIQPDASGWLESLVLGCRLGRWTGTRARVHAVWLRLYDGSGQLIPTAEETAGTERQRAETERQRAEAERQRAETERQRAEAERQRAEAAEAEVRRLRALLERDEPGP